MDVEKKLGCASTLKYVLQACPERELYILGMASIYSIKPIYTIKGLHE